MKTLEATAASKVVEAIQRDCMDAELQPLRDRIVFWIDSVPFALKIEQPL